MPWNAFFCVREKLYGLKLYDIELSGLNNIHQLKAAFLVSVYFQHLKFLSYFFLIFFIFCGFACFPGVSLSLQEG